MIRLPKRIRPTQPRDDALYSVPYGDWPFLGALLLSGGVVLHARRIDR